MKRTIITYSVVPFLVFMFFYFVTKNNIKDIDFKKHSVAYLELDYNLENNNKNESQINKEANLLFPFLGQNYVGFKEALAFKESQGNYFAVNTLGYLGKYQFGAGTLKLIGITNTKEFLSDPKLQEKAFLANAERNKWILRKDIKRFSGKYINGVLITESGILAAAHLAGPGNVKKYLRTYGQMAFADAYGMTIRTYMKKFSGYDTSFIISNKKAKARL